MSTEQTGTRVIILAGTLRIKGTIDLLPGSRVTDFMNEAKGFIAVTDAEVWEMGERRVLSAPFINVSREHVVVVAPG